MHTFALEDIEVIKGKQKFDQLVIDGIGQLDAFEKDLIDTTYKGEFRKLLAYMEYFSNNNFPPKNVFRELKGAVDKEYEFKSKHLRIYVMQQPGGKIVVIGGYKNSQDKDIIQFRAIKKQYLNSLKK